jgi:hypothetical protein
MAVLSVQSLRLTVDGLTHRVNRAVQSVSGWYTAFSPRHLSSSTRGRPVSTVREALFLCTA